MHTGQGDIDRLGEIITWNKSNRTDAFKGKCGDVTGSSDGLFAPGLLKKAQSFDIWSTDTCRKLTFTREGKKTKHGIEVEKFKLADNVFDNGTLCEGNLCYENNLPTGVQVNDHCLFFKNWRKCYDSECKSVQDEVSSIFIKTTFLPCR